MTAERMGERRWTLRRRIGQLFALGAAFMALLIAALVITTLRFVSASDSVVERWDPAALATQRWVTNLVDQETGLRGYALSRDPAELASYDAAHRTDADHQGELRRLLGSDAALSVRLDRLVAAAQSWRTNIAEPAIAGLRAGDPSAVQLVESAAAKSHFDAVRERARDLSRAVDERTRQARDERKMAGIVVAVILALGAVAMLGVGYGVWRGLHRWVLTPVDRLAGQTRSVAEGDTHRRIVPDGPREFTRLGRDVEAMRLQIAGQLALAEHAHQELQQRTEELARSNEDLQQFAYVASHDLSEPLRKVANFCQLLERQYAPQLDDRARQYIDFAVDGAKRMQVLITDLLELSRVGRTTDEFVPVQLDSALDSAVRTLTHRIDETGATIERATPLPTVPGDPALLSSLLENLIGNALKYRREDVSPVVRISAVHDVEAGHWRISMHDNGIGIDPQYAERIFVVFQRLHLRDRYGGTGIGLALCRKIVEFHGGHIWLDTVESSQPGTTFTFTLPEGGGVAEPRD